MDRTEKIHKLSVIIGLGQEVRAAGERLKRHYEADELPGEHGLPGDWKAELFEALEQAGQATFLLVRYLETADPEIQAKP